MFNLPCCFFEQGIRSDHHGHDWQGSADALPPEEVGAGDRAHHEFVAQHGAQVAQGAGAGRAEVPARRAAGQADARSTRRCSRRSRPTRTGRKHERRTARALLRARSRPTGYAGGYTPRHRLHSCVAPGRGPGGVDDRLRAAGVRAGRGVPVRLERRRAWWWAASTTGCRSRT